MIKSCGGLFGCRDRCPWLGKVITSIFLDEREEAGDRSCGNLEIWKLHRRSMELQGGVEDIDIDDLIEDVACEHRNMKGTEVIGIANEA